MRLDSDAKPDLQGELLFGTASHSETAFPRPVTPSPAARAAAETGENSTGQPRFENINPEAESYVAEDNGASSITGSGSTSPPANHFAALQKRMETIGYALEVIAIERTSEDTAEWRRVEGVLRRDLGQLEKVIERVEAQQLQVSAASPRSSSRSGKRKRSRKRSISRSRSRSRRRKRSRKRGNIRNRSRS